MILDYRDRLDWVPIVTKPKQNNDVTDYTNMVYYEKKLSSCDQSNRVRSTPKIGQDNDVINRISRVYVETKTELLRLIVLSAVYDENQIRKQRD